MGKNLVKFWGGEPIGNFVQQKGGISVLPCLYKNAIAHMFFKLMSASSRLLP